MFTAKLCKKNLYVIELQTEYGKINLNSTKMYAKKCMLFCTKLKTLVFIYSRILNILVHWENLYLTYFLHSTTIFIAIFWPTSRFLHNLRFYRTTNVVQSIIQFNIVMYNNIFFYGHCCYIVYTQCFFIYIFIACMNNI